MIRSISQSALLGMVIVCFVLTGSCGTTTVPTTPFESPHSPDRISRIKQSTVRIYVHGNPKGTGFIIDERGLIATAFHVVGKTETTDNNRDYVTYASSIEVQLDNGEKLPARPHKSCIGANVSQAFLKDYCILEVKTQKKLVALRLGNFRDVRDGSPVYTCGYPIINSNPDIAFGKISTGWRDTAVSYQRKPLSGGMANLDIACLDIPMTRGFSGAPVMLLGIRSEEDRVIGIASFITTPLDQELKALIRTFRKNQSDNRRNAACSIELLTLMKETLESDSLFIKGCISVDSLRLQLQRIGKNI